MNLRGVGYIHWPLETKAEPDTDYLISYWQMQLRTTAKKRKKNYLTLGIYKSELSGLGWTLELWLFWDFLWCLLCYFPWPNADRSILLEEKKIKAAFSLSQMWGGSKKHPVTWNDCNCLWWIWQCSLGSKKERGHSVRQVENLFGGKRPFASSSFGFPC